MGIFNVSSIFKTAPKAHTAPTGATTPPKKNQILYVCTGNIARSAAAELISTHRASNSGWIFTSAGTGAMSGYGVAPDIDKELMVRGIDISHHVARQISEDLIAESTLILVMEKEHLNWIVREWPQYRNKVHLLKQMARVSQKAGKRIDPVSYMNLATDNLKTADNIADPYRRGMQVAADTVVEIETALDAVLPWLGTAPKDTSAE